MLNNLVLLEGDPSGMMNILMIVALVAIFYFFMIRPQQKRQKEIKKFREGVAVGDRVVTAGGIHGKVRQIKDTVFVVEVSPNVNISVEKSSVYPSAEDAMQSAENENVKKQ